ncbi:FAD-dependent oxidoreductase [Rhodococcus sp. NCIMB 12038]|uniref:FAD-dependent oxidoreductase n=1 Tax=Rhodococcus sp. NCIMB 12038 TaxID=933800 RepID=UPI0015C67F7E|nr:FAD-dependent oxidoreductase [Rhodococcus sp. NCIMB 12038]
MPASQSVEQLGPTVAVIGSGPSGCYTAQFLRKERADAEITVFEALPVPYGLVRYGVAADHQGTKAVARQFDRMFERNAVTFVGNTRIGVDISFEELTSAFDVVVIATGLPSDRQLEIPRDEDAHVVGAGRVLRTLNAFPEEAALANEPLDGELGDDLIVVGQGNVAVDVVRLLTKASHHLTGSDIDDRALDLLRPTPPKTVRVIGRSPASNAKFDLAMLRELCGIDTLAVQVEGLGDSEDGPVVDLLRAAVQKTTSVDTADRTVLTLHFDTIPTRIRHQDTRTVLEVTGPSGETDSYAADTVITAIGFCQTDDTRDDVPVAAWSGAHVYRVGWLDRNGRGNIAENRKHAQTVARSIVADLADGRIPPKGAGGLATVLPQLHSSTVGFDGWLAIDEAERSAADTHRCRRKITNLDEMVAIAHSAGRSS